MIHYLVAQGNYNDPAGDSPLTIINPLDDRQERMENGIIVQVVLAIEANGLRLVPGE